MDRFVKRIEGREATVGIVGLGYVGLPLVLAFHDARFPVIGFDVDPDKIERLETGKTYIRHIPDSKIAALSASGRFAATTDAARLSEADAVIICVPTPIDQQRNPDLSFVSETARVLSQHLRNGQLVSLESTTYPGTCAEVLIPTLESGSGLTCGTDFDVVYSPEREDPANPDFDTRSIPKVVGGHTREALEKGAALYGAIVDQVVRTSGLESAEAVKITENVFRAVNIALVNELKVIFERMDIDVWEVIEAASTKPFGYMPFYPGPGLGGHCIPVDPFYLAWKARAYGLHTRFIELSGEINRAMPDYVVERVGLALNAHLQKPFHGARVLLIGVAYKKNVDDQRESPGLDLIEKLEVLGCAVSYHDPHIPVIKPTRAHPGLSGRTSIDLDAVAVAAADIVLIAADHEGVDYAMIAREAKVIVDTRNAMSGQHIAGTLVKA